ncbi:MAG: hypothetical protein AAF821_18225 [Cyanobacteria bacterium P01_D01_bin.156]
MPNSTSPEDQSSKKIKKPAYDPIKEDATHNQTRHLAIVDYIVRVLLKVPHEPPPEDKKADRPYSARFFGDYLFGYDFDEQRGAATTKGAKFRKGEVVDNINTLVAVINRLRQRLENKYIIKKGTNGERHRNEVPVPTNAQLLEALQVFTQLSPEELQLLNLPVHSQHPLLQKAFINLATIEGETVPDVYREVYELSLDNPSQKGTGAAFKETLDQIKGYVGDLSFIIQDGESDQQISRIEHAIERLLLQAGTGQTRFLKQPNAEEVTQQFYIRHYLGTDFIEQLSATVQANNKLRNQLPVYLKKVALEPVGPFPLPRPDDDPTVSWFSDTLLTVNEEKAIGGAPIDKLLTQLPSRPVMRVILDFYIRLNKEGDKQGLGIDGEVSEGLQSTVGMAKRLHFEISTTGLSGSSSLITRAMNQALLSDIACLRDIYYPIARDIYVKQAEAHQQMSPAAVSHSFVQLCRNDTLIKAMRATAKNPDEGIKRYDVFAGRDARGSASFTHIDMVTSLANAVMLSRLEAIVNASDIDKKKYLQGVLHRVEQRYWLEQAQGLLTGYPFSSFALSGWMDEQLLDKAELAGKPDTTVVHNARLTVAETFLVEGNYNRAYEYLEKVHDALNEDAISGIAWLKECNSEKLDEHEKNFSSTLKEPMPFHVVSGQLMARYEMCLARYFTVLDGEVAQRDRRYCLNALEHNVLEKERITRTDLIEQAWTRLIRAEQHLTVRLLKYHMIEQSHQATARPYYQLLAQIYLHRAMLLFWYPSIVPPDKSVYTPLVLDNTTRRDSPEHSNRNRLYLLERARVYAGCDGDDVLYVICTAYQCRAWLMTAFTIGDGRLRIDASLSQLGRKGTFNKHQSLAWAKSLRNHCLIQYAETGKQCYHATKEKSGISIKAQPYGNCTVESLPQIRETINDDVPGYKPEKGVLDLDMRYLSIKRGWVDSDNPNSSEIIYLFGPQSCHLFLIRGLYHLCSDAAEEFEEDVATPEQWDSKLEHCYRLFTYAYALAGNGCDVSIDENGIRHISRQLEKDDQGIENDLLDKHAMSVWNLFPLKIAEVTDIGCVMAAACAALRCYTSDDKKSRCTEVKALLGGLYSDANRHEHKHQFNGYLFLYLERCSEAIVEVMEKGEMHKSSVFPGRYRNELLTELFSFNAL